IPLKELASSFCTVSDSPAKVTVLPAERADAYARSSRIGNLRCSRIFSVVWPTAPVAPTTAIRCPPAIIRFSQVSWCNSILRLLFERIAASASDLLQQPVADQFEYFAVRFGQSVSCAF